MDRGELFKLGFSVKPLNAGSFIVTLWGPGKDDQFAFSNVEDLMSWIEDNSPEIHSEGTLGEPKSADAVPKAFEMFQPAPSEPPKPPTDKYGATLSQADITGSAAVTCPAGNPNLIPHPDYALDN